MVPHHRALSLSASPHRHPDLSAAPACPVHATILRGTLLSPTLQCWGTRALRYVRNSVLFPKFQSRPTLFLPKPIPVPRPGPFTSWTGHTVSRRRQVRPGWFSLLSRVLIHLHIRSAIFAACHYVPGTVRGAGNKTLQTSRRCPPGGTSREGHARCH